MENLFFVFLLTWRGKLVRKILEKFFSCEISYGPEENNGPNETRMSQDHAFVSRKLADAVREHYIIPMILQET